MNTVTRVSASLLGRATLLSCLALSLLACGSGRQEEFQIRVGLSPTPPLVGDVRVIVHVLDGTGTPVEGAAVEISGTAADGTSTAGPVVASEQGGGRYVVAAFPFATAGDWTLRTSLQALDGRSAEREERVRVSGPRR